MRTLELFLTDKRKRGRIFMVSKAVGHIENSNFAMMPNFQWLMQFQRMADVRCEQSCSSCQDHPFLILR